MRRVEERTCIIIEMITMLFIVLFSLLIQYSDSKITDHNNAILTESLEVNRISSDRISHAIFSVRYLVASQSNITVGLCESDSSQNLLLPEFRPIIDDLKNGRISKSTYLSRMFNAHYLYSYSIGKKYHSKLDSLKSLIENGTWWVNLKKVLFVIQIAAAVFAAFMYGQLFIAINRRVRTKNS